jgi:hypothetical protein
MHHFVIIYLINCAMTEAYHGKYTSRKQGLCDSITNNVTNVDIKVSKQQLYNGKCD